MMQNDLFLVCFETYRKLIVETEMPLYMIHVNSNRTLTLKCNTITGNMMQDSYNLFKNKYLICFEPQNVI